MASRYQEQSLPIKLMTISNAEDVRRNSNRHPPVSATMSGPHSMYGGSNGMFSIVINFIFITSMNFPKIKKKIH